MAAALICLLAAAPSSATRVKVFKTEGAAAFLGGDLSGVSVDPLGRISLSERVEKVADIEEPFVFTAVRSGDGWVVGTGNSGKVLRVAEDGTTSLLFDAPETEVFALLAEDDGSVLAATSPNGKVYRIPPSGGETKVAFDPEETYIWALARNTAGQLLVATGTRGRLYAVGRGGEGRILFDSQEPHIRSLLPLPGGDVLVGTAGGGRILRVSAAGKTRTVYDAIQPEIVTLAPGPEGSIFAAALASEASAVDLSQGEGGEGASSGEASGESGTEAPSFSAGSRPSSFSGARSEVLKILPSGVVERLGAFKDETVYSVLWFDGRLWVGTGQEGKLYSHRDGGMVLEKAGDEKQLVALVSGAAGPTVATANPAALFRTLPGKERAGTYTSSVLDAVQVSRFGSFRWRGEAPARSTVEVSFRTGLSSEPDETWTPWSTPRSGTELSLEDLQRGRFLQWKAELGSAAGQAPRIDTVEISYLQQNLRPRVEELSVLEPGQILVPANFNPANQVFEPAHPNRDGIFTTLSPGKNGSEARVKPLWKLGYRSLKWKAEDPNQDPLIYSVFFRSARGEENEDWLPVVEDIDETQYSFDATVLPDGVYRFRLVASDAKENRSDEALDAERLSGPVVIDHTPPAVLGVRRTGGRIEVQVQDAWNPLREAVVSADAGEWTPAEAADGLIDGRREALRIAAPDSASLLLLRLTDAAHNVVTIDLLEELP